MTFSSCKQTLRSYSQNAKVVNENFIMHNGGWIILYEAIYILNDLYHQRKSFQVLGFHSIYICQVYTNTREPRFCFNLPILIFIWLLVSFWNFNLGCFLMIKHFSERILTLNTYFSFSRGWVPKFATGLIYQNRYNSKSIWVTKLVFCQNHSLMGESFWPKDSLITYIIFELCMPNFILAQSQILGLTLYYKSTFVQVGEKCF